MCYARWLTNLKSTIHLHPKPTLNRAIQYGAVGVLIIMGISVPLQILLALTGLPGGLLIFSAGATLFLAAPVLLLTVATPAVSVADDGITLHPVIWRTLFIPWEAVRVLKDYPLLPPAETEVSRRAFVGRKKYQAAEGVMLVIPSLPIQYRVTGFFVGERLTPVIALTNRTHSEYEKLVKRVRVYVEDETTHSRG